MKTLLLSDRESLQTDLELTLSELDPVAEVWRAADIAHGCWFLARDTEVKVIFIDLSWCGHQHLIDLMDALLPWSGYAKIVLLLDDLSDLERHSVRRVRSDLRVPRSIPRRTFRLVLSQALRPAQAQNTPALVA